MYCGLLVDYQSILWRQFHIVGSSLKLYFCNLDPYWSRPKPLAAHPRHEMNHAHYIKGRHLRRSTSISISFLQIEICAHRIPDFLSQQFVLGQALEIESEELFVAIDLKPCEGIARFQD